MDCNESCHSENPCVVSTPIAVCAPAWRVVKAATLGHVKSNAITKTFRPKLETDRGQ